MYFLLMPIALLAASISARHIAQKVDMGMARDLTIQCFMGILGANWLIALLFACLMVCGKTFTGHEWRVWWLFMAIAGSMGYFSAEFANVLDARQLQANADAKKARAKLLKHFR